LIVTRAFPPVFDPPSITRGLTAACCLHEARSALRAWTLATVPVSVLRPASVRRLATPSRGIRLHAVRKISAAGSLRDDAASEAVFAIGNQVGVVARKIYDPENTGTTIDIGALGHTEALAQSATLLAEGKSPKALAGRRKRLFIDGLGGSSETARQALSDDEEILYLDRLTKISAPVARALAGHWGALSLNGVTRLSKPAARALASHRGPLFLNGLLKAFRGGGVRHT
jgi:hypothetical protein